MESSQAPEYHYCKLCNASFSLTARLIRHTQGNTCNKPSCRQCEKVFLLRNQLYQHRREKCQGLTYRHTSSTQKLSTPATPPATPPPRYRIISPPPPAYKAIKDYLTVKDLYIRYTPLRATNKHMPPYLRISDLSRLFGRRSVTATAKSINSATASAASATSIKTTTSATSAVQQAKRDNYIYTGSKKRYISSRHRGRCLVKKGDRSTKAPKYQNTKNPFSSFPGTPLRLTPYKSILLLQRSRLISCPAPAPSYRSFFQASSAPGSAICNRTAIHQIPDAHHRHISDP